jgi:hypothetical protein
VFAFLRSESEADFCWALRQFSSHAEAAAHLVGTDRYLGLINALNNELPSCPFVICQWHDFMSVRIWARKYFAWVRDSSPSLQERGENGATPSDTDLAKRFSQSWKLVVKPSRAHTFLLRWQDLKREFRHNQERIKYLDDTWLP